MVGAHSSWKQAYLAVPSDTSLSKRDSSLERCVNCFPRVKAHALLRGQPVLFPSVMLVAIVHSFEVR